MSNEEMPVKRGRGRPRLPEGQRKVFTIAENYHGIYIRKEVFPILKKLAKFRKQRYAECLKQLILKAIEEEGL